MHTRRDFLKQALVAGSSLTWMGCSHFEELVSGETKDLSGSVVIIGGGIAGLSAAMQLKKRGLSYRIYEASGRVGGRVLSVPEIGGSYVDADLGAEWIADHHAPIFGLLKELKLKSVELGQDPWGAEVSLKAPKWIKLFQRIEKETYGQNGVVLTRSLRAQYPKAVKLDEISAQEMLNRLSFDFNPEDHQLLTRLTRHMWGAEPEKISALAYLDVMTQTKTYQYRYHKIQGGAEALTRAMYERVAGVIPEKFVRLRHKLVSIEKNLTDYELEFQTPSGSVRITTKNIINTLPPVAMLKIEGIKEVLKDQQLENIFSRIHIGSKSKSVIKLSDRESLTFNNRYFETSTDLMITKTGVKPTAKIAKPSPFYTCEWVGANALNLGRSLTEAQIKHCKNVISQSITIDENASYHKNWQEHKGIHMAVPGMGLGYYQSRSPMQGGGSFYLAGDAFSEQYFGTLAGAVESGAQAANRILIEG